MPTWPTPNTPRPFTYRMAKAIKARRPLCLLSAIEFPSGYKYYWTGVGTLVWNGVDWTGVGVLGAVNPIKHNSDLTIQEVNFVLSGVDTTQTELLDENVRNKTAIVWLACLDDSGNVIPDPYQLIEAQLDYQAFNIDDNGVATVTIVSRTGFYTLDRAVQEAWTEQQQKSIYPDDSGLDMIASLQNQALTWKPS